MKIFNFYERIERQIILKFQFYILQVIINIQDKINLFEMLVHYNRQRSCVKETSLKTKSINFENFFKFCSQFIYSRLR